MKQRMKTTSAGKKPVHFDPRSKLLLMLPANMVIVNALSFWLECAIALLFAFVLYIGGKKKVGIFCLGVYGATAVLSYLTALCLTGPLLMIGMLLVSTTRVSEFIAAMEKLHLPQAFTISLSVMFRFFPTVREEWDAIQDAMRLRGIGFSVRNLISKPLSMLEYILVPLLGSAVKIGEELSAAALTRGLGAPNPRTSICKIGFEGWDMAVILLSVLCTVFMFL
jgi:energy-coupling factor transport system permease protein